MAEPKVTLVQLTPGEMAVVQELRELSDQLSALEEAIRQGQAPRSAKGSSTAAALTVPLNLRQVGAVTLEVWVQSSVAATFRVEGSADGVTWRLLDSIVLDAAGERSRGYLNAYPVVRVKTDDSGDHQIEVVAAR